MIEVATRQHLHEAMVSSVDHGAYMRSRSMAITNSMAACPSRYCIIDENRSRITIVVGNVSIMGDLPNVNNATAGPNSFVSSQCRLLAGTVQKFERSKY